MDQKPTKIWQVIIASSVGTMVEWYESVTGNATPAMTIYRFCISNAVCKERRSGAPPPYLDIPQYTCYAAAAGTTTNSLLLFLFLIS